VIIVVARRYGNTRDDVKRCIHTFMQELHAGVDLKTAFPIPVVAHMQKTGFPQTVKIPEAAIGNMWS
jgi:hypothetical protein